MPRPHCVKTITNISQYACFKPNGVRLIDLEEISLSLDELEALRLSDYQGLYQEASARAMGISRQTFGRIIENARRKTADAILNGKALRIGSGNVQIRKEGDTIMKIAIPAAGDQIDQHFGHCEKYAIFTVDDTSILSEETMESTKSCGCKSGIAGTLAQSGVSLLLAGGIGDGAIKVLSANGIRTIKGAAGKTRNAVEMYLRGELADSGDTCRSHGGADHVCEHG